MDETATATFLFTDIEASTRLWEREPERMRPAMARHDALAREVVRAHGGHFVKKTGDGLHAAFADALDAVLAAVDLQLGLARIEEECGLPLRARCGMHAGAFERRDDDYYGTAVNRAARIMAAAHGGQVLLSSAVAGSLEGRLPSSIALRDLGAARLRDLSRPERIYQMVHESLRADFPALRSLEGTPHNLPGIPNSFIGRSRELDEVESLLAQHRLVTVTGMGGLGKTRLTLELGTRLLERFPDGVWFVELAPLGSGRWVAQALASVLGVTEEPGRPVIDAVSHYLREREALVILDNCEHLVEACAELASHLLRANERTRMLASSREPLRIAGEAAYPLATLSAPDDAVRLFVDRATAALPTFDASDADAASIASICRRLDGIPLALELAAARVRTLGVRTIAERLDSRFELLASGERNVLPRQQTLRALIDWSYDLLGATERSLLRVLSVFAGSWTLEAAEAVGDGSEAPIIDTLGLLVEKSLVIFDPQSGRYRLLETVREYAREKLEGEDRADAARDRHLAHYLALVERARPELFGPEQASWLARLDLERENILAAESWSRLDAGRASSRLRLVGAMKHYWFNRGLLDLGHRLAIEALGQAPTRDRRRGRALYDAGQLALLMGRYREARAALEEGLAIGRELGDDKLIALILQPLGMAALCEEDVDVARACLEEALASARRRGDRREYMASLSVLGQIHRVARNPESALAACEEALGVARELDDRESVAIALLNLAMVSLLLREVGRVRAMLIEAASLAAELRSRRLTQSILEVAAGYASDLREWERAARFYGDAELRARETRLRRDPADEAFLAPRIEAARAALGAARFALCAEGESLAGDELALETLRGWLEQARPATVKLGAAVTRS